MKGKIVVSGTEARELLLTGVNILADAVKVTLGHAGDNVIIESRHRSPVITKDGVSIAKEIYLANRFHNLGAQIVCEVSERANEEAGDGTTTATVLAQEMMRHGHKAIQAGAIPIVLKRGMDLALADTIKYIADAATDCVDVQTVSQVATISGNSDPEVGNIVTEAYSKLNFQDAVITVTETTDPETSLVVSEGITHDSGYASPLFINNERTNRFTATNAAVLVLSDAEPDINVIQGLLHVVAQAGTPLVIIAPPIENEVANIIGAFKAKSNANICVVRAPGYGMAQLDYLRDIAIYTGGKVVGRKGEVVDITTDNELGTCGQVTVSKQSFTIVNGAGTQANIDNRIASIRSQLEETKNKFDIEILNQRIGKFTGSVAVVRVGGHSASEVKEKRDRIDDALCAVAAAISEGVVAGGGALLAHVSEYLASRINSLKDDDTRIGYTVVQKSLQAPLRQIITNCAGAPDVVYNQVVAGAHDLSPAETLLYGYDAAKGVYGNMMDLGIIDPAKVTRCAVLYSTSVAGLMLTTSTLIVEDDSSDVGYNTMPASLRR